MLLDGEENEKDLRTIADLHKFLAQRRDSTSSSLTLSDSEKPKNVPQLAPRLLNGLISSSDALNVLSNIIHSATRVVKDRKSKHEDNFDQKSNLEQPTSKKDTQNTEESYHRKNSVTPEDSNDSESETELFDPEGRLSLKKTMDLLLFF